MAGGFGNDLLVGRRFLGAAGIAGDHARHALHVLEDALLAPEAAARQNRGSRSARWGGSERGAGIGLLRSAARADEDTSNEKRSARQSFMLFLPESLLFARKPAKVTRSSQWRRKSCRVPPR